MSLTEQLPPTVGQRAVRGAALLTGATYISVLLGIGARKAIALLLTPDDVGVYQAALSFVDLVISFAGFSFASAIINVRDNLVKEPLDHLRENVFVLTVTVNAIFTVLAMALGLTMLPRPHGIILSALIGVYAVQRFVSSLDTFYTQILERELSYSRISRVTLLVNIVLHVSSVGFAFAGGGAWAIPLATVLSTALGFLLDQKYVREARLHAFHTRPWRYYNAKTARWLWRFGTRVFFNRLFESWLFRIDNMWVVYLFGPLYLGYYSQAFSIALLPSIAVAPIVARVSIATYAGVQHDKELLARAFQLTNFFLVRVLVPATVFLLVESDDLVRAFLSSNWGPVSEPLVALAGAALTVPLFENAKMILGAQLRLKEISYVRGGQLLLLGILLVSTGHGIMLTALCVTIVSILGYFTILIYIGQSFPLALSRTFSWPLVLGAAAFAILHFVVGPEISLLMPEASSLGAALVRLIPIGVITLLLTVGLEFLITPAIYKERLAFVISKARKQ
jgi:O-antigen/teichoic acid export membrane protein